jgi:hypothetical protein
LAARGAGAAVGDAGDRSAANWSTSSWDFTGFSQGLKDTGYVEGQSLAVDVRWANNDPGRFRALATDLVRRRVRVIATFGSLLAPVQPKLRPIRSRSSSVLGSIRCNRG